jgi:hypothetical protein
VPPASAKETPKKIRYIILDIAVTKGNEKEFMDADLKEYFKAIIDSKKLEGYDEVTIRKYVIVDELPTYENQNNFGKNQEGDNTISRPVIVEEGVKTKK